MGARPRSLKMRLSEKCLACGESSKFLCMIPEPVRMLCLQSQGERIMTLHDAFKTDGKVKIAFEDGSGQ